MAPPNFQFEFKLLFSISERLKVRLPKKLKNLFLADSRFVCNTFWWVSSILKTCGTTTLLCAVDRLIDMVKRECGYDTVAVSLYSCS